MRRKNAKVRRCISQAQPRASVSPAGVSDRQRSQAFATRPGAECCKGCPRGLSARISLRSQISSLIPAYGPSTNMLVCCYLQGSALFLTGVAVVLYGWAVVGMGLETYGFWLLFADFFPTVLSNLRNFPVLGTILDLPVLKTVSPADQSSPAFSSVVHCSLPSQLL